MTRSDGTGRGDAASRAGRLLRAGAAAALLAATAAPVPGCVWRECYPNKIGPEFDRLRNVSAGSLTGSVGSRLPELVVQLKDECNPLPNVEVSWQVSAGGGVVSPPASTTDISGLAGTIWTLPLQPGEHRVTASAHGHSIVFTATATGSGGECGGTVLGDPFAADTGWTKTTEATPGFADSVRFEPTDGVAGGYRRMTHLLAGRGSIFVSHWFGGTYNPRTQGVVRRIRYSEDRKQFDPPFAGAAVGSGFLVEQEGRRVAVPLPEFRETTWQPAEMDLVPGALPGIDLSAAGGPIRFGYYRSNSDSSATVQHGIDNWRVELCR